MSRAVIHELGFPAPVLQFEVTDRRGLAGIADFGWPEHSLLGEFDGLVKYTRNMTRPGENIDAIVVREKIREDRMRATGRGMTRWLWKDALQPALLDATAFGSGTCPANVGPGQFRSSRAGNAARIERTGPDSENRRRNSVATARIGRTGPSCVGRGPQRGPDWPG